MQNRVQEQRNLKCCVFHLISNLWYLEVILKILKYQNMIEKPTKICTWQLAQSIEWLNTIQYQFRKLWSLFLKFMVSSAIRTFFTPWRDRNQVQYQQDVCFGCFWTAWANTSKEIFSCLVLGFYQVFFCHQREDYHPR